MKDPVLSSMFVWQSMVSFIFDGTLLSWFPQQRVDESVNLHGISGLAEEMRLRDHGCAAGAEAGEFLCFGGWEPP